MRLPLRTNTNQVTYEQPRVTLPGKIFYVVAIVAFRLQYAYGHVTSRSREGAREGFDVHFATEI